MRHCSSKGEYLDHKVLYWRVAGVDGGNNVGDFTPAMQIGAAKQLRLVGTGEPQARSIDSRIGDGDRPDRRCG